MQYEMIECTKNHEIEDETEHREIDAKFGGALRSAVPRHTKSFKLGIKPGKL